MTRTQRYIEQNFDVDGLVKIGLLHKKQRKDYEAIEKRICQFFNLRTIFEYSLISRIEWAPLKPENIFSEN